MFNVTNVTNWTESHVTVDLHSPGCVVFCFPFTVNTIQTMCMITFLCSIIRLYAGLKFIMSFKLWCSSFSFSSVGSTSIQSLIFTKCNIPGFPTKKNTNNL